MKKKLLSLLMVIMLMLSSFVSFATTKDEAYNWKYGNVSEWAYEELVDAVANNLVLDQSLFTNCKKNITREEFAKLVVNMYTAIKKEDPSPAPVSTFKDTSDTSVRIAYNLGIINGVGDGLFAPNNPVTREQMGVMIFKAVNALGVEFNKGDGVLTMTDKKDVSSWAVKGVDYVYENNFMKGNGINFNPKGTTTVEQAVAIANRVYKKYETKQVVSKPEPKPEPKPELKPEPKPEFNIEKNGSDVDGLKYYGGFNKILSNDNLRLSFGNGSDAPLGLALNKNNTLETFKNYGVYEADFSFDYPQGNAGFVFAVSSPKIGNDMYRGYFVGIDAQKDSVFIGKSNFKWDTIATKKLPFDIKAGKKYNLKAVRNGSRIDIYVNDVKYISTSDSTYIKGGYFGVRVWKTNATYEYVGYNEKMGSLKPKEFYIENIDGEAVPSMRRYGGNWKIGETLKLWDNKYKQGPMVLGIDRNNNPQKYPSSAFYKAKFNFTKSTGNAGIVFNVSGPKVGNDQYRGNYVGINYEKNTVIVGKSNYKWHQIKEVKIPFSIANGKIDLEVRRIFSEITVYVDGVEICTVHDESYTNEGYFGARVWNASVEYTELKAEKVPF
ncbi:MAG: S-layer homology domain-containing protein [Tepidibacter sp.]|uniref:S-layer homology domain-containing protein n=1 Tax=Tepidibacter sp. TaxID=2529387 RepID=UPI0025E2CC4A|nr:S-layer homology domain-containing protein [Tepidibacter sp.]MCT4509155.1 S-layer homology domain-containing protein [Tepidibacter sp.]